MPKTTISMQDNLWKVSSAYPGAFVIRLLSKTTYLALFGSHMQSIQCNIKSETLECAKLMKEDFLSFFFCKYFSLFFSCKSSMAATCATDLYT